jgi:multidrug efflux pump subunit AcrA (membrane-fusion protein)
VSDQAASLTQIRKRRARIASISAGVVVAIVAAYLAVAAFTSTSSSATTVSTATAAKRTLTIAVSGSGTAAIADSEDVYPLVAGTVNKVYVSEGDTVTAGDRLYTIDTSDIEAAIQTAKAQLLQAKQSKISSAKSYSQAVRKVASSKVALTAAKSALAAAKADATSTAAQISAASAAVTAAKGDVSDAKSDLSSAAIGLKVAKISLTSAQDAYDVASAKSGDTVVTAPIDGVVTDLPLSVGTEVSARTAGTSSTSSSSSGTSASTSSSSSGVTISNMSELEVQMSVSEVDVASVQAGQVATVTFDAVSDTTFKGHVTSVADTGSSSSGVVSYVVDVALDSTDSRLKVGMTATVDIQTQVASDVLVVPSTAVGTDNSTKYVQVVGTDGTITKKTVTTGVSDDTYMQILTGLTAGQKVVVGTVSTSTSTSTSTKTTATSLTGSSGTGGPPSGAPGGN